MIARLTGTLLEAGAGEVIVDVHGVGYRLHVPDSAFRALPAVGRQVELYVHTHVRDDAIQLYGFVERRELRLFETLIGVSGIGPRLALGILSHASPDAFIRAVLAEETGFLTKIPGIGKKSAARILLELKDKLKEFGSAPAASMDGAGMVLPESPSAEADAVAALVALGYAEGDAAEAVRLALADAPEGAHAESLIRGALKRMDRAM